MTAAWLSRARLRRDAPAVALAPVLVPDEPDARAGAAHRLIWTLFGDHPERRRDFLWREETPAGGRIERTAYYILSTRPPVDAHHLFELDEPKPFAPALDLGDRLRFCLRANPVVTRDGQRHDVVMDRLRAFPKEKRAERRFEAMSEAGRDWLVAQGERAGFELHDPDALRVDGYDQVRINRHRASKPIRISVLDFTGTLRVLEPELFVPALLRGFGKAKAFGFGLMLVRRT